MTQLDTYAELSPDFMWRDKNGIFHNVKVMTTWHLVCALKMVWNHSVQEEEKQIKPFNYYTFTDFYTKEYMSEAFKAFDLELHARKDIKPGWLKDLQIIETHLKRKEAIFEKVFEV